MLNIAFSRWYDVLNTAMYRNGEQVKLDHDSQSVQFNLPDSIIWLSSTPPCTFQDLDLDLHFVASSSLSGEETWLTYLTSTREIRDGFISPPQHMYVCIFQPCWICVLKFLTIQDTSSVRLDCFREGQSVCTAYLLIAPSIYLPVTMLSFIGWLCLSDYSLLLSLVFLTCC